MPRACCSAAACVRRSKVVSEPTRKSAEAKRSAKSASESAPDNVESAPESGDDVCVSDPEKKDKMPDVSPDTLTLPLSESAPDSAESTPDKPPFASTSTTWPHSLQTISPTPPTSGATTASPSAIASMATNGVPSTRDVTNKISCCSATWRSSSPSSDPNKVTETPNERIAARTADSSGPAPIIVACTVSGDADWRRRSMRAAMANGKRAGRFSSEKRPTKRMRRVGGGRGGGGAVREKASTSMPIWITWKDGEKEENIGQM